VELIKLLNLMGNGFSRWPFFFAQVAVVGSILRAMRCMEHQRAFEVYENAQTPSTNYQVITENRSSVGRQVALNMFIALINIVVVLCCILTGYTDMRLAYGYYVHPTLGCNCSECCWKEEWKNDATTFGATSEFSNWRMNVLVRGLLAIIGFFAAYADVASSLNFKFCTFPILLPKGLKG